jgi:hypothetical protein
VCGDGGCKHSGGSALHHIKKLKIKKKAFVEMELANILVDSAPL